MKISMSKGRLLAVLALLLGCALLWRGFFEPGRQRGMPQDTPPVRVATALAQDMPHFLNGLGTVEPSSDVLVTSRVDGHLQRLHFTEGQFVHKGDLLAEIDPRPFEAALGEARGARSTNRREYGHGALAERALLPVIPPVEEFPYAIRVVSEVVSSNGSTSQGSICGSTLALMDAGVPIKAPVAGISCGLIQDDDGSFTTFIDIQGVEDFHGEMDFKVAGTKKGITAIQMDLKNDGLTMEIIKNALDITYDARCQILDQVMLPCIAQPRPEVSKYAPKMVTMHIDPDKIRDVIGKGGSVIQKIVAESGAKIDIDDDGTIHIASPDAESCEKAKKCIDDIVFVPEVGQLYYGRVVRLMTFGAFVELAPGKDGLVHISKLADKRIEKVEDACKIGDMMWVKVTEIDEKGRVNLSHKDAMKEIAAKEAAGEPIK